jgi:hypothetical protein
MAGRGKPVRAELTVKEGHPARRNIEVANDPIKATLLLGFQYGPQRNIKKRLIELYWE